MGFLGMCARTCVCACVCVCSAKCSVGLVEGGGQVAGKIALNPVSTATSSNQVLWNFLCFPCPSLGLGPCGI